MYENYFNFKTKPFELVPNPDFLFLSKSHKKAISYLDYGIKERIGFILLSGEVGSGKTTIVRNIIKNLNGTINLSKVFNTKVSSQQLIAMVNEDFGLEIARKDKVVLLRDLNDYLIHQYAQQRHSLLIIDEAQNLTPDLLEEVRMLSNLETDQVKLLQIILVGQPELKETLSRPELKQLRQRISISCHISPLSREESEDYIYHRLAVAGNRDAVTFAEGTIDMIHEFSKGIPRLINVICDFLLLSCFVEENAEISIELTQEIAGELASAHSYIDIIHPGSNKVDVETLFKDLISRLKVLEAAFSKHNRNTTKKINIMEKISQLEKYFNDSLKETKNQMDNIDQRLQYMMTELSDLKLKIDQFEKRYQEGSVNKREGLRRILS